MKVYGIRTFNLVHKRLRKYQAEYLKQMILTIRFLCQGSRNLLKDVDFVRLILFKALNNNYLSRMVIIRETDLDCLTPSELVNIPKQKLLRRAGAVTTQKANR